MSLTYPPLSERSPQFTVTKRKTKKEGSVIVTREIVVLRCLVSPRFAQTVAPLVTKLGITRKTGKRLRSLFLPTYPSP